MKLCELSGEECSEMISLLPIEYVTRLSPIEFVLVGAAGYHDRVLARSENCGLDLIGFSQQLGSKERLGQRQRPLLAIDLASRRRMQYVISDPIPRGSRSGDFRESSYILLAWFEFANRERRD